MLPPEVHDLMQKSTRELLGELLRHGFVGDEKSTAIKAAFDLKLAENICQSVEEFKRTAETSADSMRKSLDNLTEGLNSSSRKMAWLTFGLLFFAAVSAVSVAYVTVKHTNSPPAIKTSDQEVRPETGPISGAY